MCTKSICFSSLLTLIFSLNAPSAHALDNPHNPLYTKPVSCASCHQTGDASWWSDQESNVCGGTCHNAAVLGEVKTHRNASGGVVVQCTNCHHPHEQRQDRRWGGTVSALYTSTSNTFPGSVTTSTLKKSGANWTAHEWQGKLLLPDVRYPAYIYKIQDNDAETITIVTAGGDSINISYCLPGATFAIEQGKFVKDIVNNRDVKFFRETGTNSFADTDATADGICQVCHTGLTSFNDTGTFEGPGHPASAVGTNCTLCHKHKGGFKPNCKDCHGMPPVADSQGPPDGLANNENGTGPSARAGAHSKHAVSMGYACETCHTNGMPASTIYDKQIQIGFNIAGGAYQTGTYNGRSDLQNGYTYSTGNAGTTVTWNGPTPMQCSNIYCHGSTIASGGTNKTPQWDVPSTGACGTCHGVNSGNYPTRGSHTRHTAASNTGYALGCQICHKTTTTDGTTITDSSKHVNNAADWAFDTSDIRLNSSLGSAQYRSASSGSVPNPPSSPYGTCSTVYCHSKGQSDAGGGLSSGDYKTPQWGIASDGQCGTCHNATAGSNPPTSGSHTKHAGAIASSGYAFACTTCHSGFSETSTTHADGKVNVNIDTQYGDLAHGVTPTSTADGKSVQRGGFSGSTCSNTYCHSNGAFVSAGTISPNTSANWGTGTLLCNSCHGYPPDYANGSPKANSHSAHISKTCNQCHSATTSDNTTIANPSAHVNKQYDLQQGNGVTFNYTFNATGGSCSTISCHGGMSTDKLHWGETSCVGCHSVSQGNRVAITPQFSANSHHIQGLTVTDILCYQCHWEAKSDGTVNSNYHGGSANPGAPVQLVIYGSGARPTTYTVGTTAVQYTAGSRTEIQKINQHCLGCHSDKNNGTQPFGDGKTPKQYAWDSTSVDLRYSQTGTTPWGKYSSTTYPNADTKDKVTKAYSAHGNAANNQRGWNQTTFAWSDTSGSVNVACFDCHNSHGSSVAGLSTSYTSSTTNGGLLKDTTAGNGGYTMTYKPQTGGSSADHNAYNPGAALCFDCHLTANSGTTPWGYQDIFGASQSITGYRDTPYFGSGTSGGQQRYSYKQGILNSSGGHFGASSAMSTTPGGTINGLCTPCHDPHGVSTTLGTNQKYGVPLLKGTWMTSVYQEDATPSTSNDHRSYWSTNATVGSTPGYKIDQNTFCGNTTLTNTPTHYYGGTQWNWNCATRITETASQFGGLCLQCHPKSSISPDTDQTWQSMDRIHNTVQGWGGYNLNANNAVHSYTCSKCHTPHNSRLPRLMISNCLNYSHRGRVNDGGYPGGGSYSYNANHGNGSGSGKFPAGGTGSGTYINPTAIPVTVNWLFNNVTGCHSTTNGSPWPANQQWNVKTNWVAPSAPVLNPLSNGLCSSACPTTLSWNASTISNGDQIEYYAQIDTTSSFNSPNLQNSGWISGTSWLVTLATNTTYYWEARARDKFHPSWVSSWSSSNFYLSDGVAPPQVSLSGPADGFVFFAVDNGYGNYYFPALTLTWDAVPPFAEYYVQVSTDPTFATGNSTSGWISATSYNFYIPSSVPGIYYWRVQARDTLNQATGPWSSPRSFTAIGPPTTPAPLATSSGLCSSACLTTLRWNPSTSPDSLEYSVQVDTTSSFNSPNLQNSGWISGTSWEVTLATNATYYWKVQARDKNYTYYVSSWGWGASFYLSDGAAPPQVALSSPADGYTTTWGFVTVTWNAVPPFAEYYVQVSTDPTFATVNYSYGWTSGTSYTTFLGNIGKYYWHVQARDTMSHAAGPWSSPWSLTYYGSPAAPVLIATDSGLCSSACSTTLQWNPSQSPDPLEYYVQVDTTSAFNSLNLQSSGAVTATNWTPPNALATNKAYYWHVQAKDQTNPAYVSPWSSTGSFVLWDGSQPPPIAMITPADAATQVYCRVCSIFTCVPGTAFYWTPSSQTVEYDVQVSTTSGFTPPLFSDSGWLTGSPSYWSSFASYSSGAKYYWRVLDRDPVSHITTTSPAWSYTCQ